MKHIIDYEFVFALSPLGLQPGSPVGYCLRRNQRIPTLVFDPILSDDKFLCQKVGLGSPTQASL